VGIQITLLKQNVLLLKLTKIKNSLPKSGLFTRFLTFEIGDKGC